MIWVIIALFALAAMGGGYLLRLVLSDKPTPKGIAMAHGFVAAAALVLLIIYTTRYTPGPIESLIVFVLAALGGVFMFTRDITARPIPKWLAVGHGVLALVGFTLLLVFALRP